MSSKHSASSYDYSKLTSELRYEWVEVAPTPTTTGIPFWTQAVQDHAEELINSIVEESWPVAFLRQLIRNLELKPKGRTRVALARQLVEGFVSPKRITQKFGELNAEERSFFAYKLLYSWLQASNATPVHLENLHPFSQPVTDLTQRILDLGLGLQTEQGAFFVPFATLKSLPPFSIAFATEPAPKGDTQAIDPVMFSLQLQQFLSLIQSESYTLRLRPRWKIPNYPYASTQLTLPPTPEGARKIINQPHFQGRIDLLPPEPLPDTFSLDDWISKLGLSAQLAEFIFHVLVGAGILRFDKKLIVDTKLAQEWLMLSPGQQVKAAFQTFQMLANWSAWIPLWRKDKLQVGWNYQYYWGLTEFDRTLGSGYHNVRQAILDVLVFLPQDTWLSVEAVGDFLISLFPEPKNLFSYHGNLLLRQPGHGWKGFLRCAFESILRGPLYWMGFVECAPDRDHMTTFRMRALQDVTLERLQALPASVGKDVPGDALSFDENRKVLEVTPPVTSKFLMAIQRWAIPAGLKANKLRYTLDIELLHAAYEQGETPESLEDTWVATAGFAPPAPIRDWWEHYWSRYGHIRLYTEQTALMTRDEFTMQEIQLALPKLREAIVGLVTPRTALLQSEEVDRIMRALERQGYMVKEDS